jgi:hypothetical protein
LNAAGRTLRLLDDTTADEAPGRNDPACAYNVPRWQNRAELLGHLQTVQAILPTLHHSLTIKGQPRFR